MKRNARIAGVRKKGAAAAAALLLALAVSACTFTERPAPGAPALTIPLDGLAPYEAPAVTMERRTDDCAQRLDSQRAGNRLVEIYRSTDGNVYAAVRGEDGAADGWVADCFFAIPNGQYDMTAYRGLFGHDGVCITYQGQYRELWFGPVSDYYFLTDDGTPVLLARVNGMNSHLLDLDGDGQVEVAAEGLIFFQRDGTVYEADLRALLSDAWPEMTFWDDSWWDDDSRRLTVTGFVTMPEESGIEEVTFLRTLSFDGERLLVYRDERTTTDHVMEGIEAPDEVLAQARAFVQSRYDRGEEGVSVDDWRVEALDGPYIYESGGRTVEAYALNYELHTATLERVTLAGGRYLKEDGWVSPDYPGCDWLFFLREEKGALTFLKSAMINDMSPDSDLFHTFVLELLK